MSAYPAPAKAREALASVRELAEAKENFERGMRDGDDVVLSSALRSLKSLKAAGSCNEDFLQEEVRAFAVRGGWSPWKMLRRSSHTRGAGIACRDYPRRA